MHHVHPKLKVRYIEQREVSGQSHAISLASQYLDGPMLVFFPDTLIKTDYSFLPTEIAGVGTWVKAVPGLGRFGVSSLDKGGWVNNLVEKPKEIYNNLALAGCYYFQNSDELLLAIQEQMQRNISFKNEFFLADAINIMLEHGLKMRVERVEIWLDTGHTCRCLEYQSFLAGEWSG